jgi:hypothetical protein
MFRFLIKQDGITQLNTVSGFKAHPSHKNLGIDQGPILGTQILNRVGVLVSLKKDMVTGYPLVHNLDRGRGTPTNGYRIRAKRV